MADAYWRYSDARQPLQISSLSAKRPRSDYDIHGGHDLPSYYRDDDRSGAHRVTRDTDSIGASYDRYLRSAAISSYGGGKSARSISGGLSGHRVDDPQIISIGSIDPGVATKSRTLGLGGGRDEIPLPPEATSTLFVEGLPSNCRRREVAHILFLQIFFALLLDTKKLDLLARNQDMLAGGDPLVLCFVDFASPAHAATAMDALQGYKFDEHSHESNSLRLQFARYPGARSSGGPRGKR
ncbi:hypothetical protein RJ641_033677 [Dillenia turbinata]|uniref:RRM domain-containing protein n=1 Tax=Dillenia turbinata TaxID=194707 RepID=A0AAN8ZGA2_9MAGN